MAKVFTAEKLTEAKKNVYLIASWVCIMPIILMSSLYLSSFSTVSFNFDAVNIALSCFYGGCTAAVILLYVNNRAFVQGTLVSLSSWSILFFLCEDWSLIGSLATAVFCMLAIPLFIGWVINKLYFRNVSIVGMT